MADRPKCPGQDTRYWGPDDIFDVTCSGCGTSLEFFKDEGRRTCPECSTEVVNPRVSLGCARWCQYARECLGFDPQDMPSGAGGVALVDALIRSATVSPSKDPQERVRIRAVVSAARELAGEEGADPRTTLAAAALCETGPDQLREVAQSAGLATAVIDRVATVVASCRAGGTTPTSAEGRVLWDALILVKLDHMARTRSRDEVGRVTNEGFLTTSGQRLARTRFC